MVVPAAVSFLTSKWRLFISAHPLAKGVIAFSIVWPTSSFIQQTIEGRERLKDYDWMRILRFSIFGGCWVAPTLYGWLRVATTMWPQTNLRIGALKAVVEQISYAPFASTSFFVGMSLLEGKGIDAAIAELKDKFPKTVKIAIFIIPVLQTINFGMVPEHNRILFVSFCSLFWITFLAHMQKNANQAQEQPELKEFQHHLPIPTSEESLVAKVKNALAL